MLVLADLWVRPTLARAVIAGAICGALTLVRSEQLVLLVIAVAPILLLNQRITIPRRLAWTGVATLTALVLIAPWTIYNLGRFEEPVVLSTNVGGTLLAGNCPPDDVQRRADGPLRRQLQGEQLAPLAVASTGHKRKSRPATPPSTTCATTSTACPQQSLPVTAALSGCSAQCRPSTSTPKWMWQRDVAGLGMGHLVLAPRAARGLGQRGPHGGRATFQWPLLAPLVIVVLVVTVTFGDPRYHTLADLGLVVLAAVGLERLVVDRPARKARAR